MILFGVPIAAVPLVACATGALPTRVPHVTQARALRSSTSRQAGLEQRAWTPQFGQ
jgi:hypothetical protein